MEAAVVMALASTNEITTCVLSIIEPVEDDKATNAYTGDVGLGSVGAVSAVPSYVVEDDL